MAEDGTQLQSQPIEERAPSGPPPSGATEEPHLPQEMQGASVRVGSSSRVELLSKLLKQQQEVIFRQENVSRYFSGDMLRVAEKCWAQIHPHIGGATEEKYRKMFEEFQVLEQLSKLDQLKSEHSPSTPAWRPSGIPSEDYHTAASAEAVKLLPEFERQYAKAQSLTEELEGLLKKKQQESQELEDQIRTALQTLNSESSHSD